MTEEVKPIKAVKTHFAPGEKIPKDYFLMSATTAGCVAVPSAWAEDYVRNGGSLTSSVSSVHNDGTWPGAGAMAFAIGMGFIF